MSRKSAATQYALDVVKGDIVAGKLVRLACHRHLDDIKAVKRGTLVGYRWNAQLAEAACDLFMLFRQYKGEWAGQPLELLPWEKFVVGCAFGWQVWSEKHKRWIRRYREVYVSVGRGNGKTTMASGIGLKLFDFDNEPGAEVYFIATKKDQAKKGFDAELRTVQQSPTLAKRMRMVRTSYRMVVDQTMSFMMPLGRDSDTEHGLNPHGAVVDELHVHRNRDMVDAIETALGKRVQPLLWYITTAGIEAASIYTETDDRARRVVQGLDNDPRMLVYIATLDEGDDWKDPEVYLKSNPSLGHNLELSELVAERDKAIATPGRQASFKRLRLNVRTNAETAWLDLAHWDSCQVSELSISGLSVLGIDLGGRRDLSAVIRVTIDDVTDRWSLDARIYMPVALVEEATKRDGVPYQEWIDEGWIIPTDGDYRDDLAITKDLLRWGRGASEIALDPWNSSSIAAPLTGHGLTVIEIPQTIASLSDAVNELENSIVKHTMQHLGNPVMRWMLSNTSIEERIDGGRKPIKIDYYKQRRHIDGVSATLNALARIHEASDKPAEEWTFGAA